MKRRAFLEATAASVLLLAGGCVAGRPGTTAGNRATFHAFVESFYGQRRVAEAFERFVDPAYIQHNPGLADGRDAAVAALAPMFANPGARFEVKHVLVDGDLALVHLWGRGDPATPGAAVADLYRFQDGRIVEHWDVLQPLAAGAAPPAAGPDHRSPPDRAETERNRAVIGSFASLLFDRRDVAAAFDRHVAPDLIQHNPRLGEGRAGSIAALGPMFAGSGATFSVKRILVDGDLAAIHYHGKLNAEERGAAVVELFRLERGTIVEHWDVFQPVPENSRNPHPMF